MTEARARKGWSRDWLAWSFERSDETGKVERRKFHLPCGHEVGFPTAQYGYYSIPATIACPWPDAHKEKE